MKKNIVFLKEEITKKTIETLNFSQSKNNFLIINSNGGDFNASLDICEKILKTPCVKGYADEIVASAAFTVLQCCKKRVCKEKTILVIHPIIPKEKDTLTIAHLRAYYSVISFIAWRTKHTIRFLWELFRTEKTLTAKEALVLNFVDRII